jgi:Putative beta-barrel porin 2
VPVRVLPLTGLGTVLVRKLNALASAFGLLGMQEAVAADEAAPETAHRPQWSVLVSFSPTYTNNALYSRDDRRRDVYAEPDVTLRLDGKLTSDISYRLYGRSAFDTFAQEEPGNETFAILGARLTRPILDWRTSIIYEHRFEFTGVYQDLLYTADDVMISTTRDFSYGPFTVSPTAQLSYRFADVPEARRYRLDLVLPFEARITSRWSLVSTPFLEAYWFTDGFNEGRQDIIYSTSLGLRYSIANNISLTTSASYEWRTSNVPLRHYRELEIGPRLDLAF